MFIIKSTSKLQNRLHFNVNKAWVVSHKGRVQARINYTSRELNVWKWLIYYIAHVKIVYSFFIFLYR